MRSTPLSLHYANPLLDKFGKDFFQGIPQTPGVYFMHSASGEALYIGKAKNLRSRLAWYKNAKPGSAPEHTLELLDNVREIRWEELATEEEALLRESELLHSVRPPFNIAGTWPQAYLYIGLKASPVPGKPGRARIDFQLTSRRELAREYRVFGCFKHRRRTKAGYTALLRLLHAASDEGRRRFSFPARITRSSPPYLYSIETRAELVEPVARFLAGRDLKLLRRIVELMLENENIPRFMHPGLQDDFNVVQEFYRLGPKATHQLRLNHGIKRRIISHRQMDLLLRGSIKPTA